MALREISGFSSASSVIVWDLRATHLRMLRRMGWDSDWNVVSILWLEAVMG